jgi:hypothetical protein
VAATSAARNRLLFFLFVLWPFTVLMKQTRQAVYAVKQCIFLTCLWSVLNALWNSFKVNHPTSQEQEEKLGDRTTQTDVALKSGLRSEALTPRMF